MCIPVMRTLLGLLFIYFVLIYQNVTCQDQDEVFPYDFKNMTNRDVPNVPLIHFGRKSYYIGNVIKGNFFQAEQFCRYHGMNLISILSKDENTFIQRKLIELGNDREHFWTSGTKLPDSIKWVWFTTGRPLAYTRWAKNQPNNEAKDNECIKMYVNNSNLQWYNVGCWDDNNFICETTWRECEKIRENKKGCTPNNGEGLIDVRLGSYDDEEPHESH